MTAFCQSGVLTTNVMLHVEMDLRQDRERFYLQREMVENVIFYVVEFFVQWKSVNQEMN